MASPYFQHNGTFQLIYDVTELEDFKIVSRPILLNGLFKLRLKGYVLSTQAETEECSYDADPSKILDVLNNYDLNPILKLQSPQFVNQITPQDGFLIPISTNTDVNVLPLAVQTAAGAANTKWIVSHKPTCVVGDPLHHYISVNLNSNIISFQARLSVNDGISFNTPINSYLAQGTIILTFEYESLKAV
jgi:hypothetical protein